MKLRFASLAVSALLLVGCSKDGASKAGTTDAAEAGHLTVVQLPFAAGDDLSKQLAAEVEKAKAKGQRPYVEFWADWCGPCKKLEASMGDERMKKAFDGVYLVRADSDKWGAAASAAGFKVDAIPVFYEIGSDGKPNGRTISGAAWDEDIPENMAPPLDKFFHGG